MTGKKTPAGREAAGSGLSTRTIVMWGAGSLLFLGLVFFCAHFYVTFRETREVVGMMVFGRGYQMSGPPNPVPRPQAGLLPEAAVRRLGGGEKAAARLSLYLRMPDRMAPDKFNALFLLGLCGKPAVPALARVLEREDKRLRLMAASLLGKVGPDAAGAVPALAAALGDEDDDVRGAVVHSLGRIGAVRPEVVPALVRALGDSSPWVRRSAVRELGDLGPAAEGAMPALKRLLNDEDFSVRCAARQILEKLRREESARGLVF